MFQALFLAISMMELNNDKMTIFFISG